MTTTIKKLLEAQGAILAETLHWSKDYDQRKGCYEAWRNQYKLVTDGVISHETFKHMERGFYKRLDELEPLIELRTAE